MNKKVKGESAMIPFTDIQDKNLQKLWNATIILKNE